MMLKGMPSGIFLNLQRVKERERAMEIQNQTITPLVLEPPKMKKTEKRSICLCFAQPSCLQKREKKKESGLVREKKKVNRSRLPINPGSECQRYQTLCSHDCVRKIPYAPCLFIPCTCCFIFLCLIVRAVVHP
jgi:hypothetical protein